MGSRSIGRRQLLTAGGAALTLAACRASGEATPQTSGRVTTTRPVGTTAATVSGAEPATTIARSAATTSATAGAAAPMVAFTAADFDGLGTCRLLPELAAGPFPLDEQFDRRDITEGLPGHPMRLGLRVVDTACAPVPAAVVEIWHTDATGDYSAFTDGGNGKDDAEGTTYLRGSQTADGNGIVEFHTIYPGWYPGRAVHIHLRVHLADTTALTSQLFFDDAYTESVYTGPVYADNGSPDTPTYEDGIAGDPAAEGTLLQLASGETANGPGTVALLNLGVDTAG